jgi:hypothetical protein
MKPFFAILVTFSTLAMADPQWIKVWEGDIEQPQKIHMTEEVDGNSRDHKGSTARIIVRTTAMIGQLPMVIADLDTFDCVNATYTIQSGKGGPGAPTPVKQPVELAVYQFACN